MSQNIKDEKFSKELIMKMLKTAFTLGSNYVAFPEEDFETELEDMTDYLFEKHEETKVSVGSPAKDINAVPMDYKTPMIDITSTPMTPVYVDDSTINLNSETETEKRIVDKLSHQMMVRESVILGRIDQAVNDLLTVGKTNMQMESYNLKLSLEEVINKLIKSQLGELRGKEFMKKQFGIDVDEDK